MPSTLSILTATFPAARARQGDRHLGRRLRHRHRDRPRRRRLADRARRAGAGSSSSTCRSSPPRWSPAASSCPRAATPPRRGSTRAASCSPSSALTALVWAIIEAPTRGWTDGVVLGAFAVAAARAGRVRRLGAARARSRCSTSRLFRNPRFSASSAAISLAFFALFGVIFFLTQYLQDGARLLGAGGRRAHAAGRRRAGRSAARSRPSSTARLGTKRRRRRRPGDRGRRAVPAHARRRDAPATALIAAALVVLGFGMALRDGAGDRRDHGLAAAGQDERRLGDQRHDPRRRRRARRRGARVAAGQRLPWRHGHAVTALPPGAASIAHDSLAGALAVARAARRRAGSPRRRAGRVPVRHARGGAGRRRRSRSPARSSPLRLPAGARGRGAGERRAAARPRARSAGDAAARPAALGRGRRGDPARGARAARRRTATAR